MPLKELLFSSKGRIPRSTWWYFRLAAAGVMVGVSVVVIIILVLASGAVTDVYADSTGLVPYIYCLIAPFWLLFIFFDIMVSIKRCHDRNRSGWFLLWSYVPSTIYTIFSWLFVTPVSISYGYSPSATDNAALGLNCVLSLVTSGLGLWVLIELGFMKGTAGPNQYGPDPTMPAYMQGYQVPGQPGPAPMGYNQPGTGQAWYEQPGGTPGEAGVSSGQIKECKHCGEAIEAEAAFCKYCGRAQT